MNTNQMAIHIHLLYNLFIAVKTFSQKKKGCFYIPLS